MELVPRLLELADRDTRVLAREARHSFVSAFVARRVEAVQAISVPAANLLMVLEGTKTIWWSGRRFSYRPGEAFAMPPGACLDVVNEPDRRSGVYRALLIGFSPHLLDEAQRRWRLPAAARRPADPRVALNQVLASAILHTSEALSGRVVASPMVQEQRILEVLLLLAEQGAAPLAPEPGPGTAVAATARMVRDRPAFDWTAQRVAARLGISESTLRRSLRAANTGFRELVAAERMRIAHELLTQGHDVTEAALTAGYASLSHFAKRFKASYGCLPSRMQAPDMPGGSNAPEPPARRPHRS
jgi:AraC-like DNA-binding protein